MTEPMDFAKKKALQEATLITVGPGIPGRILHPTVAESRTLTQEDVWGRWQLDTMTRVDAGMVVAQAEESCPVWGDRVPSKSVTVVCASDHVLDVIYWLEFVQGGGCVSRAQRLDQDRVALRADYMAW